MPVHNSNCKPFTFDSLVSQLYSVTEKFPDKRTGNNIRYTIEDAALGAFSIFFYPEPILYRWNQLGQVERQSNTRTWCRRDMG